MSPQPLSYYEEAWVLDFEFQQMSGENPEPHCLVAYELKSQRTVRLFAEQLRTGPPPFRTSEEVLFISYYSSAEWSCFLTLGWPLPVRILDLYAEFRNKVSGTTPPAGYGLIGAMTYFGLDCLDATEKKEMRDLAIRGGPFSPMEVEGLLNYCENDVRATANLFGAMVKSIDFRRALLRGRYMAAVARMETCGIPIDSETLAAVRENREFLKLRSVEELDEHGLWIGTVFRTSLFEEFLSDRKISWPRLRSGGLCLDDDTFKMMARLHPELVKIRELRRLLGSLRVEKLSVGHDSRNRVMISPFGSKTGRNQPSNSKFIFGQPKWLRSLVKPEAGRALAYIDFCQQEFGIAAALSNDRSMQEAYRSGDPYLAFARQAGAIRQDATGDEIKKIRDRFKRAALGVLYGMSSMGLAASLGESECAAEELLRAHRNTYPGYWEMSEAVVDSAVLNGTIHTCFGWQMTISGSPQIRSIQNFPMQAHGAEILRLACCIATESGVNVCAPVHDALLVEASLEEIETVTHETQEKMVEAGKSVLDGFELRTEATLVRYPERFTERGGLGVWEVVMECLDEARKS